VRYIDHQIARIYPEMMYYEQVLGVGGDTGIQKYFRSQPPISEASTQLLPEQKQELVAQSVKDRRIGRRGHEVIDAVVFGYCLFSS
jgi:hypothetical protein